MTLFLSPDQLWSQAQPQVDPFEVGLVFGVNAAQISGDPYQGYRKWGLQSGVEGRAYLGKNKMISGGALFSQLGSFPSSTERKRDNNNYLDFRLSYIELPVAFHFLSRPKSDYYSLDFHLGVSIGRLLSSRIVGTQTLPSSGPNDLPAIFEVVDLQERFNDYSFNLIVGISKQVHPNWGFTLRHNLALNAFFEPSELEEGLDALQSFYFSLTVNYYLR
ncbi:MAG: porin family protein [Bacteroidota bacterium]